MTATMPPASVALPELPSTEPLDVARDPEGVRRLCEANLVAARARFAAVASLAGAREPLAWQTTFGRLDEARLALANAVEVPSLLGFVHPDAAVRAAGAACEAQVQALESEFARDPGLAAVVARAATAVRPETEERRRFVERVVAASRRAGAHLSPEVRARLATLEAELTASEQAFSAALAAARAVLRIPAEALAGTSDAYRKAHPPSADGKVRVGGDADDVREFVTFARTRKLARELYVKQVNRGGDANVARVDRMLALRREKAKVLGFDSWVDLVTAGDSAGSAREVRGFLDRLEAAIAPHVAREAGELRDELLRKEVAGPWVELGDADRPFLVERLRARRFRHDAARLAEHLEVNHVTQVALALTGDTFGLAFQEVSVSTWEPTVRAYDVTRGGAPVGRLYLDLTTRPDKPAEPATFAVKTRGRLAEGRTQLPAAAVIARMPGPREPMAHEHVQVLFHELGHALQQLLTTNELASFSGTRMPIDAVEAPALILEEWAWSRPVLERLARHRQTGKPAPPSLLDAAIASRRVGAALALSRQLYLARVDLALHTAEPPFDATELLRTMEREHTPFVPVDGTHLQSSFAHLVGYDGRYYGYAWSSMLAREGLTRMAMPGVPDPTAIRGFEAGVLVHGGAREPRSVWREFIGREPSERSLVEFVAGR
ncbi:MAG: oligopeptidase A [Deltaproteobacteria bacterium]|nr:oligopeptidase A [Deltaproteobacteria bacterium]